MAVRSRLPHSNATQAQAHQHKQHTAPQDVRMSNQTIKQTNNKSISQNVWSYLKSWVPKPTAFTFIVLPNDDDHVRHSTAQFNGKSHFYLYGEAYDVRKFASRHPGGSVILQQIIGQDCTDFFSASHPKGLVEQAIALHEGKTVEIVSEDDPTYQSGTPLLLASHVAKKSTGQYSRTEMQREFDEIVKTFEADGLFEPTKPWYCLKVLVQVLILSAAISFIILGNMMYHEQHPVSDVISTISPLHNSSYPIANLTQSFYEQQHIPSLPTPAESQLMSLLLVVPRMLPSWVPFMISAFILGIFWQQLAFLGHDAGHNQVTGANVTDYRYSWLVTATFGVSGAWWRRSHNVHHVHTNSIECDPDIQHLPIFAVDEGLLDPFFSTYHQKLFSLDAAARVMVAYQHLLYYPVMAIARVNLYAQSLLLCCNKKVNVPRRKMELLALAVFWMWYIALLSSIPTPGLRWAFHTLSHAVAGLIHVQITLSHFAMPAHHGPAVKTNNPGDDFFWSQFSTTMNVDCPEWFDWFHGGLQFQIEHHLLPRLPRKNLRKASVRIRQFADKFGLPYHAHTFIKANCVVYDQLKRQADTMRTMNDKAAANEPNRLWQGIMAEG